MVKIIVADDHVVLREGLKALLKSTPDWDVVAEANNGFEVLPLVEKHSPDIVILDLGMPNLGGLETICRLQKADKSPAVLVLSARNDEYAVAEAMRAGARAYVPKSAAIEELEFALKSVLKGQTYLSPSVCGNVLSHGVNGDSKHLSPISMLTNREREVMKLLSEGKPNREVAKALHISPRTIDTHRANIMKKLGISSNAELVQVALKHGLIE